MSSSSIFSQQYVADIKALLVLLEQYISTWRSAPTEERRLAIESTAVSTFEKLIELDVSYQQVSSFDYPEYSELNETYKSFGYLLRLNLSKLEALISFFLKNFNSQQLALLKLNGQIRRIKQKQAALAFWNREGAKYVLAEHFNNLDVLDSHFVSKQDCNIDSSQGVLTLPIRNVEKVGISKVRIGVNSNGVPGNSDFAVQTNNTNPRSVIDGNANTWFEYERLDAGPLSLSLVCELPQAKVLNQILIEPLNSIDVPPYEIEDILFSVSGRVTSIKTLLGTTFEPSYFTVRTIGTDPIWSISFLPVEAASITIKFKQDSSHQIKAAAQGNKFVLRDRYAVGVKSVALNQILYERTGAINSKVQTLPAGLYSIQPVITLWPDNESLFDLVFEISSNGGESWKEIDYTDAKAISLLSGSAVNFAWRLAIERKDEAFSKVSSLVKEIAVVPNTRNILRTFSRFQSPVELTLPSKPTDQEIVVLQPGIARRGDRFRALDLGRGKGHSASYRLPVNVNDISVEPTEVAVYVSGRPYTRVEDDTSVGASQWAFTEDYNEMVFDSNLPDGAVIEMAIEPELALCEERSDGFYYKFKSMFDPEKLNIKIEYLPRSKVRKTFIPTRAHQMFKLGHRDIIISTFSVTSKDGVPYNLVGSRTDVFDGTDFDYYVDYVNGMIYFSQNVGTDIIRISYEHFSREVLADQDFDIVYENSEPWGIRILKEKFQAEDVSEVVGDAPIFAINIKTGRWTQRSDPFTGGTNAFALSHENIVRGSVMPSSDLLNTATPPQEVPYIDGHTEFLGLIPIDDEKTIELTADAFGTVEFNLNAGGLWYQVFDVLFSDTAVFASKVAVPTIIGEYSIADDGTVIVFLGAGNTLASGIDINYYYRDPAFDAVNKYSLNYEKGYFHVGGVLNAAATVTYKTASYQISYDLARKIKNFTLDPTTNVLSIKTEAFLEINSLIRVLWKEGSASSTISGLTNVFSPIVSTVALRFN